MIFFFLFSLSYSKNSGKVSVGTWFLGLGSSLSYMWALTFPFLYIMSPHIKEKKSGQGCQHSCLKERNKLLDGHYSHSIPFIIMAIKEKLFLSFIKKKETSIDKSVACSPLPAAFRLTASELPNNKSFMSMYFKSEEIGSKFSESDV